MSRKASFSLMVFCFVFLAHTVFVLPQMTNANISGTVKDDTGAVLPGSSVVVRNLDTGAVREVVTGDMGTYRAPNLSLGNYEVRAELVGFKTEVRRGIVLTVGRQAVVDFSLQVGEITEEVVVTGEAPLVETQNSTLSGLVEGKQIMDLPLNGRSLDQLIALQAGTNTFRFTSQGSVAAFSIGGQRWQSNKFYQDGVELSGGRRLNDLPGSAAGVNLGVDAIREFRVVTNNFGAEHGKRIGGVISTVTKSGTNKFHGTAFFFHRNDNLDAKNFFDDDELPEFRRHNFGFSIGGPIVQDKTFFFLNYESLRQLLGQTQIAIVPDENARNGFLPDPNNPGGLIDFGVAPEVAPYFGWWPLPNGRNFGDGTAESLQGIPQTTNEHFFIVRVDHTLSDSDSLFVSYKFDDAEQEEPENVPSFFSTDETRYQYLAFEEKHLFSAQTMNVLRAGYHRTLVLSDTFPVETVPGTVDWVPGLGFGQLRLEGGTGAIASTVSRAGGGSFNNIATNSFQFSDQVRHTRGRHSWHFGVQIHRLQWNGDAIDRPRGIMLFNSLDDFLVNNPNRYTGPIPLDLRGEIIGVSITDPSRTRGYRQTYFGSYAEDQMQLRSNFTLNLGLRWEFMTSPSEVNGRIATQVMDRVTEQGYFPATTPRSGNPLYKNNSLTALGPRLGIAWDPFSTGRTSVRAGFGMFFEQIEPPHYHFYNEGVPPAFLRVSLPNPSFPQPFAGGVDISNLLPDMYGVDENIDVPTAFHFNLGVQHQLTDSLVAKVAYAGSTGYHLLGAIVTNVRVPEVLPDGRRHYSLDAPPANPNHSRGRGEWLTSYANSSYNSVQFEIEQRFTRGLRYKAAFTVSKSIDNTSNTQNSQARNSPSRLLDPVDTANNRALSGFDLRRMFTSNFTYETPALSSLGAASWILGDWQLNGIISVTDGNPFTIRSGINSSQNGQSSFGDRPNLVSGRDNNPVLGGPDQYFDPTAFFLLPETAAREVGEVGFYGTLGRNTVTSPGFANFDFSLSKIFRTPQISEDAQVQLKFDFFNIFNRANFHLPRTNLFRSGLRRRGSAGRISTTANANRQIQLGLRISF